MNIQLKKIRKDVDNLFAIKDDKQRILERKEKELLKAGLKLRNEEEAHLILQTVAEKTQQQLEASISELVTSALSIFPNPYEFNLTYVMKRNKTEAEIWFSRDGHRIYPLEDSGYGPVDVGGFALRVALWAIRPDKLDNVIIMDEPFKNINDKTRELHVKASEMVKEIADKLGIQFIVVSQIPELEDIADRVFEVSKTNNVSKVEKVF